MESHLSLEAVSFAYYSALRKPQVWCCAFFSAFSMPVSRGPRRRQHRAGALMGHKAVLVDLTGGSQQPEPLGIAISTVQ